MAAEKEVDRHQEGHGEKQTGDAGKHQKLALIGPARRYALHRTGIQAEIVEQAVDAESRHREHSDLTQGVETAKIDQDDIDHIGPAASRGGCWQENTRKWNPPLG